MLQKHSSIASSKKIKKKKQNNCFFYFKKPFTFSSEHDIILYVRNREAYIMKEEWKSYYLYLEELRDSGVTNMFGAGPYLAEAFDLDLDFAHKVLANWMQNYSAIADRYYKK